MNLRVLSFVGIIAATMLILGAVDWELQENTRIAAFEVTYPNACGEGNACSYFYCNPDGNCYHVLLFPDYHIKINAPSFTKIGPYYMRVVHYDCRDVKVVPFNYTYLWNTCFDTPNNNSNVVEP